MSDHSGYSRIDLFEIREIGARVVWVVAAVCAVILLLGALLIALKANPDNGIREFVVGFADRIDGPFTRVNGLFTFDGKNAAIKSALANWGIAAVVYAVVGKALQRIIRP